MSSRTDRALAILQQHQAAQSAEIRRLNARIELLNKSVHLLRDGLDLVLARATNLPQLPPDNRPPLYGPTPTFPPAIGDLPNDDPIRTAGSRIPGVNANLDEPLG